MFGSLNRNVPFYKLFKKLYSLNKKIVSLYKRIIDYMNIRSIN